MPVTYKAQKYGAYVYGDTLESLDEEVGYRHRYSKSMSRDGAFASDSLHDPRRMTLTGTLTGASNAQDAASLRTAKIAFLQAHAAGPAQKLMVDSDQYINAQVEHLTLKDSGLYYEMSASFLCFDPFWYAVAVTTQALTVPGNTVITTSGTAYSLPVLTLIVSAAPAGGLVTLANAQDTTLAFAPPATGTFTIDCAAETVTDVGGVDQTGYFTGDFIRLIAGLLVGGGTASNTLSLTLSGGVTLTSASIQWQDRWY